MAVVLRGQVAALAVMFVACGASMGSEVAAAPAQSSGGAPQRSATSSASGAPGSGTSKANGVADPEASSEQPAAVAQSGGGVSATDEPVASADRESSTSAASEPSPPAERASEAPTEASPGASEKTVQETVQKAEKAPPARAEKAPAKHDPPPEKPAQTGGTIVVDMRNFEHDGGKVRVALWRTENGFPRKAGNAASRRSTRVRNGRARLVFRDVPPGDFAVMVHHDEDADGELDTNMVGMPTEGFGVSRDAPANFGPPSYDDARLALSRGENKRVVITMRY